MSAMFDYITGKKTGREAELEASLEHMGGHLGAEIDDNERLRAEIERLRAGYKRLETAVGGGEISDCHRYGIEHFNDMGHIGKKIRGEIYEPVIFKI